MESKEKVADIIAKVVFELTRINEQLITFNRISTVKMAVKA